MKIIAANGGKENKTYQSAGRGDTQQKMAGLPNHYDGTDGNIQAAEDKKVDYFSQHRAGYPVD